MRPPVIRCLPGLFMALTLGGACDQGVATPAGPGTWPPPPGAGPGVPALPASPPTALPGGWDGRSTFECNGRMTKSLTGMTVTLPAGTAVRASDHCILHLVDMNITAPVDLEASGTAVVTLRGGHYTGTTKAIVATDTASVFVSGATVVGPLERTTSATIHGVTGQPTIAGVPPIAPTAPAAPPSGPEPPVQQSHADLLNAALCCNLGKLPGCRGPLKIRGTACAIAQERPECASCAEGWALNPGPSDPGTSLTRACPMCR